MFLYNGVQYQVQPRPFFCGFAYFCTMLTKSQGKNVPLTNA